MALTHLWDKKTGLSITFWIADQPGDGADEVTWLPLPIFQPSTSRTGRIPTVSGYVESVPNHACKITVCFREKIDAEPSQWELEKDKLLKLHFDGVEEAVLDVDVLKIGEEPVSIQGIDCDANTFARFIFRERDLGEPMPSTSKLTPDEVDDMSSLKIKVHHCDVTTGFKLCETQAVDIDGEAKEVVRSRSAHPRLSEYLDLGRHHIDDSSFDFNIRNIEHIDQSPHVIFIFRYKSGALLKRLGIKPIASGLKEVSKKRPLADSRLPSLESFTSSTPSRRGKTAVSQASTQSVSSSSISPATMARSPSSARQKGHSFGRAKATKAVVDAEESESAGKSRSSLDKGFLVLISDSEESAASGPPPLKSRKLVREDRVSDTVTPAASTSQSESVGPPIDRTAVQRQRALDIMNEAGITTEDPSLNEENLTAILKSGFTISSTFGKALRIRDSPLEATLQRNGMQLPEILLLQDWAKSQS